MPEPTVAQLKNVIADLHETIETLQGKLAAADKKAAASDKKAADFAKRHNDAILAANFSRIANSMGFPPESVPDVISGIPNAGWTVNEKGEPEVRDKKSGTVFYDVTPEAWLAEQAGPGGRWNYLTRQGSSQGGGGGQDMSAGGRNPWSKDGWDDMAQVRIYQSDPAQAEQLAKAAGSRIGALRPS
jgi:hypothetical protein